MRPFPTALAAALQAPLWVLTALLAAALPAPAAEVRVNGEQYVYATSFRNRNFTGWSEDGSQTEDAFAVWQRLRLRTEYVSSENLSFSVWLQVDNTPWGNGTLTVDNPAVSVQVFQAFLKAAIPGTDWEMTAGKFTTTLPQSAAFSGSLVLDSEYPSLAMNLPLSKEARLVASYGRLLSYRDALESVSRKPPGTLDLAVLSLPVSSGDVTSTPWAGLGLVTDAASGTPYAAAAGPPDLGYIRRQLFSTGYFLGRAGFSQAVVPYLWAGLALQARAGDFVFYGDVVAGAGGMGERLKNTRRGLFADAAMEYTGLDWAALRLFAWWASGEDASDANGSERLPTVVRTWNPGVSYLFSTGQAWDNNTSVRADPTGSRGLGATLDRVSLIPGLASRLTAVYMAGSNDPAPFRRSVTLSGPGFMAAMGKTLVAGEYLLGLSFDHEHDLGGGLKLIAETGWAHPGGLDRSVWGRRFTTQTRDSWKAAVGLRYAF